MINLVAFQGNLVRDIEFADTKDSDIVNFTIASSRKYKDKEDVTFVDCTAYGQTAVNIAKFFSKGNPIAVQGRLSQNNWTDRDGNKRSKIYLTVDGFHFTGNTDQNHGGGGNRGGSRGGGSQRGSQRDNQQQDNRNRGGGQRQGNDGGGRNDYDDDVPFG